MKSFSRRHFILSAAMASTAFMLPSGLRLPSVLRGSREWKLKILLPSSYPILSEAVGHFLNDVEAKSEGRLKIVSEWSPDFTDLNALIDENGPFQELVNGDIDMVLGVPSRWRALVPEAAFFGAVPFGMDYQNLRAWLREAGGTHFYEELYRPHGIQPFLFGGTGPLTGTWTTREMADFAEWKDLRIRLIYLANEVAVRAGGQPQIPHFYQIADKLRAAELDASESLGFYHDYHYGLHLASSYLYLDSWQRPTTNIELLVRRASLEGLPRGTQQAIRMSIASASDEIYRRWVRMGDEFFGRIQASGKVEIRRYPSSILESLRPFAHDMQWDLTAGSKIGRQIFDSYIDFGRRLS